MKQFAAFSAMLLSIAYACSASAAELEMDTVFDCRMGLVSNPDADPKQWVSNSQQTPLTLLIKVEEGSRFAGANQKVSAIDPAKLLPMDAGYQSNINWPSRVAVAAFDTPINAMKVRALRGRSNVKLPTFVTMSLDLTRGIAVAAVIKIDAIGNADMTGAVVGNCKIAHGAEAAKFFQGKAQ